MKTSYDFLSDAYTKIHGETFYVFTANELRDYVLTCINSVRPINTNIDQS
jgi:hypothetical protein